MDENTQTHNTNNVRTRVSYNTSKYMLRTSKYLLTAAGKYLSYVFVVPGIPGARYSVFGSTVRIFQEYVTAPFLPPAVCTSGPVLNAQCWINRSRLLWCLRVRACVCYQPIYSERQSTHFGGKVAHTGRDVTGGRSTQPGGPPPCFASTFLLL